MSSRSFPIVKVEREGQVRQAAQIECATCNVTAKFASTGRSISMEHAARWFRAHGWEVGNGARHDRCPDCQQRQTAKTVSPMPDKTMAADTPREMSREDRRIIFAKIDELYLSDKTGYSPPWTDSAVARDLGVPRAWVSQVREDLFGPEGSNAEFDEFLEQAAPVIADLKNLHRSCTAQLEEARRIAERIEPLERLAKRIEREIGKVS